MTELTIALNFIIIFLLVTAIIYGFVLNRRIKLIRESGRELAHLFRSFDDTILKAQNSVEDLKRISAAISEGLQKKIDKAALLMDDLEFMSEKAGQAADRANKAISDFKRVESKMPAEVKSKAIAAMPLVMEQPRPDKSWVPPKPSLQSLKKRALEDILKEVSAVDDKIKKPQAVNTNSVNNNSKQAVSAGAKNTQQNKNIDKKQFSIASALKALGYGD